MYCEVVGLIQNCRHTKLKENCHGPVKNVVTSVTDLPGEADIHCAWNEDFDVSFALIDVSRSLLPDQRRGSVSKQSSNSYSGCLNIRESSLDQSVIS